ncbi:MAG TPA: poly(A) polymerase [Nostocaceae cyanobacterium]|nr:poly(A) polymerase [Nostocaceae cyanobacterium]
MSRDEKRKMATSREVCNHIIWDSRLNRHAFTVGFQDRISTSGVREKPLTEWVTDSDIPWHRVRYIRCGDIIVWDREKHLDLISPGKLPAAAWQNNNTEETGENIINTLPNNITEFKPRPVYKYSQGSWEINQDSTTDLKLDTLTIASFNVLFDFYEAEKIQTAKRLPAISQHLQQCDADIIAIQEATPRFIEFILSQTWVHQYYISESPAGKNVQPYGNLLLSRLPFTLVEHQFSAHKRVLVGQWQINNQWLNLAVVHLPSDYAQNPVVVRRKQLTKIINYLQQQPGTSLIVGDFNTRGDEQAEILASNNFIDIWEKLHPESLGYTFNPQQNPLAALMSPQKEPARFDRIVLNNQNHDWIEKSINIFASEPVEGTEGQIYPSDHFGICAVLAFVNISPSSKLVTVKPVYQSAIVVIPSEEILPPIQAIRKLYDARFHRWMPHINLIYGFLPESYFAEAVEIIKPALAKLQPFQITLAEFGTFTHRKNSTAWLRPVAEPETALHELQAVLQNLFPQCNEQSQKSANGFTPHLSVGQFPSPAIAFSELPEWHPVSFTVDSVALISRKGDQPFEVKQIVYLGKENREEIKSIPASELMQIINDLEPELTPAQKIQQETVLEIVKQACAECLGFTPLLHLLGSVRLGVQSSQSDLDAVCLIPMYVDGEVFLQNVRGKLQGLCNSAQLVLDARVPALRLQIEGISLDLLYAQCENPELDLQIPANFEPNSLKAIIGCWEADLIIETVQKYVSLDAYRWLLRAVRAWAKQRRIYGNAWGFIGGFSWALLAAWSCTFNEDYNTRPDDLLINFFRLLNQYDWKKPIALTNAGGEYQIQLPRDWLPIITSIEPCQNTARNVTRSTLEIFKREFARGAKLGESWADLFKPVDLHQESDIFLIISANSDDENQLQKYAGILEGYTIGLIIQLEQLDIFVRPQPGIEKNNHSLRVILGLNLPDGCSRNVVEELTSNFLSQFNSDFDFQL